MPNGDVEVLVVGGGAAGIAAARHLHDAGVDCLIVEARPRLGGRSLTATVEGRALDLGCGWLHSGDRNPWRAIAEAQGRTIDHMPPPWARGFSQPGFPHADQEKFRRALFAFHDRMSELPDGAPDVAADAMLEPGSRWNPLIGAVTTYYSGTEPDKLSARDFANYDDSGVNWRIVEGYGTTIAAHAEGVAVHLSCSVKRIDWGGRRLKIDTTQGTIAADVAIITLPSDLIAGETIAFTPALPQKTEAAAGLPLGLADKLFLSLAGADEFEKDSRLFGRTDTTATAGYHLRPFGWPVIEVYFAGSLAHDLENEGDAAFADFAVGELTGLLGSAFASRLASLRIHRWASDPLARGSYSFAQPGKAGNRALLAEPVDDRLFFAGEACSVHDYSTAHGAYLTGIDAAQKFMAARSRVSGQPQTAG